VGFLCATTRTNIHHISFLAQTSTLSSLALLLGMFFIVVASIAAMFCVIDLITGIIHVALDRGYSPLPFHETGSILTIFLVIILISFVSLNIQCTLVHYMLYIAQKAAHVLGIPL